jgi:hypothetical protein
MAAAYRYRKEVYAVPEVIEEFWGPYYQRFRGGVCEINQHAAS